MSSFEFSRDRNIGKCSPAAMSSPDHLPIFAFIWACQALVHQGFYSSWLNENDPRGWMLTILAVGTLLRPSSQPLFSGMLLSSIVYNVAKWPFVVNHILLETIINATILGAIIATLLGRREFRHFDDKFRMEVFQRFSPVIWIMLVIMYWFAFLAKLNTDFINPDFSCVVSMYGDVLRRFPFLPNNPAAHNAAIFMTLVIEALIPLCLSFRRTRWIAILIGLPFHLILGLIGHRTFSALAYALYVLLCLNGITPFIQFCSQWIEQRTSEKSRRIGYSVMATTVVAVVALLIACELSGTSRAKIAGVGIYQVQWLIWIAWSFLVGAVCAAGILWHRFGGGSDTVATAAIPRPGLLWCTLPLVILIGLSQYLGLKTETCFTMYSNLRTEGNWNNHLFMPAFKFGPWQKDLVKIVSTNHPELQKYVEHNDLITFFELRRVVSATSCETPFHLHYERSGEPQYLAYSDNQLTQTEQWGKHSELLGMLLYFRPITTGNCVPCRH